MKKKYFLIFSGIILIIAASLLVFVICQFRPNAHEVKKGLDVEAVSTSTSASIIATSTISRHPTLTEIDSVKIDKGDWQTYKNKQYGFEISAPKSWTIRLTASDGSMIDGGSLQISPTTNSQSDIPVDIFINNVGKNSSIRDWVAKKYLGADSLTKINVPTSDESAAFFSPVGNSGAIYSYFVKKGEIIYEFDPMEWGSDLLYGDAQMNAIVESFRFTK